MTTWCPITSKPYFLNKDSFQLKPSLMKKFNIDIVSILNDIGKVRGFLTIWAYLHSCLFEGLMGDNLALLALTARLRM